MTPEEMWQIYSEAEGLSDVPWEAWAFGDAPDQLAALVMAGTKEATASALWLYELSGEKLPREGDHSVILNAAGEAVCVIRNEAVTVLPFDCVTEDHARKEGEGDQSLAYWRRVHECFFRRELAQAGLEFTETMPVVFEEFLLVHSGRETAKTENGA